MDLLPSMKAVILLTMILALSPSMAVMVGPYSVDVNLPGYMSECNSSIDGPYNSKDYSGNGLNTYAVTFCNNNTCKYCIYESYLNVGITRSVMAISEPDELNKVRDRAGREAEIMDRTIDGHTAIMGVNNSEYRYAASYLLDKHNEVDIDMWGMPLEEADRILKALHIQ